METVTKQLACRYAVVQFLPYAETGEFANVGVVLACPKTGYFGFRMQTTRWGRITGFFSEIGGSTYRNAVKAFSLELERVRNAVAALPDSEQRPESVRLLFDLLVHPREALVRFGQPRALLTPHPADAVNKLFKRYVERDFATPEYVEKNITQRVQVLLRNAKLKAPFRVERIGRPDDVHATFPFVQRQAGHPYRVIKPFNLAQNEPNDIYSHGDLWLTKLRRLQQRQLLPPHLLFAVKAPPEEASRQHRAFQEVRHDLRQLNVQVVDERSEDSILAFATAG